MNTPGPWKYTRTHTKGLGKSETLFDWVSTIMDGSKYVASVYQAGSRPAQEAEANVLLMAAAPDLADALGDALLYLEAAARATPSLKESQAAITAQKARDALKKARGIE